MNRLPHSFTAAILLVVTGNYCHSQEPVVPGFQRFYHDDKADKARGGQLLLGELNCTSCHTEGEATLKPKQAPILDNVGGRVRVSHLKKFLTDPQSVKPGTTMPNVFVGDPDTAAKVEALVHFLATTGTPRQERSDLKAINTGRDLYGKAGCVACHGPRNADGTAAKTPLTCVPLGNLKAKYTISSLAAFLDNPLQSRPAGRMPHLLIAKEAREVAHFLIQGIQVDLAKGATTFAYYEGSWNNLPDFDKLKPKATGTTAAFDLGIARRGSNYGIRFEGFFKIDQDGTYKFTLNSDDGSKLYVDGKQVVNNDGIHPPQSKSGSIKLTKGIHKVTVGFFQGGGGAELEVQVEGPGLARQGLGSLVAVTEKALDEKPKPKQDDPDLIVIQPELVAKGAALFSTAGCASCHAMNVNQKPVATLVNAAPLNKLKGEGGCLSATPSKGSPWYGLAARQRAAITAAIKKPPFVSKEPPAVIARTMTTFNCYACHTRHKIGGPTEELNPHFQTTEKEMGDEARIPPTLNGVGNKMNFEYLKQILDKGVRDRPYMHTRMPGFGTANVGQFATAVLAMDQVPRSDEIKFAETLGKVKAAGRHLVGVQGTSCIKCHTFAGKKAEGTQGMDMTLFTKRLNRDWFHGYLLDPQLVRPGTRMPASWPEGKTFYPDLLDGKAVSQIEAIWVYLKDGTAAQQPIGLGKQSIPLIPGKSAIIYRNFIQGAGTRGIAVGYPEKANLAFDANEMRLAMIWQGAFIDAAKHWTDRGVGFEGPLGDNILKLPAGVPFAILDNRDAAWPKASAKDQGYKFKGYRLTEDDRPTFLYSVGDLTIEDFPNAIGGKEPSLKRTLNLSMAKALDALHFRAAVGTKIEALGQGWYRIDGWRMRIVGGAEPIIRQSGGQAELLVPINARDGKAQVIQEFVW